VSAVETSILARYEALLESAARMFVILLVVAVAMLVATLLAAVQLCKCCEKRKGCG
jgi:hypothetical protein